MEEVKDKMKGFMKKVNNPFASSGNNKFKGQGHVLGSAPSAAPSSNPRNPPPPPKPIPKSPPPPKPASADAPTAQDFTPFNPLISSTRQFQHRSSSPAAAAPFECPVCSSSFASESEVSAHLDTCLARDDKDNFSGETAAGVGDDEVAMRVAEFMSAGPAEGSVDVVKKLLMNVAREPGIEKFRRIRMGNPKIKEAVGDAPGGVALLECVGFVFREEEDGEVWATMVVPSEEQLTAIKEAITLLEQWKGQPSALPVVSLSSESTSSNVVVEKLAELKTVDRQVTS